MVELVQKLKRLTGAALVLVSCQLSAYQNNCNSCSCEGLGVGADFLYWKLCENNMDYALVEHVSSPTPNSINQGCYRFVKHSWDPGFRVWAEKKNLFCGYNLYGSYTRFDTTKSATTTASDSLLFSTLAIGNLNAITEQSLQRIDACHHVRYQNFDVMLSFDYPICCNHSFTPLIGVEGIKIDESWKSPFSGLVDGDPATYLVHWNSDYQAFGLKIGSRYDCDLSCGFSLFALGTFSLVTGSVNATNSQILSLTPNPELPNNDIIVINNKDHTYLIQPGAHLAIGLNYERCYCGKTFKIRIGYELVDWWNMPTIRRFSGNAPVAASSTPVQAADNVQQQASTSGAGSNMMFHGLFVGAEVSF